MQKKLFKILSIIVLAFMAFGNVNATDVEFPLMQSFSYIPYSDNTLLDKGQIAVGLDIYHSNIFMFNHNQTTMHDFEAFSGTLGFRYGLMKGLNVEVYYRHVSLVGGFLDKVIENFHSAFKLPDNYRPEYPRNDVSYWFKSAFMYLDKKSTSSPLILALFKNLYQNQQVAVNARLAIGIPLTEIPGLTSKKPFLTAGLHVNYHSDNNRLQVDFSSYLSWFKRPNWLKFEPLKKQIFQTNIEVRYKWFIAGFTFRNSPFNETDMSDKAYQAYGGFRINRYLDFLIIEDFDPFNTTPDISFNVRLRLYRSCR